MIMLKKQNNTYLLLLIFEYKKKRKKERKGDYLFILLIYSEYTLNIKMKTTSSIN